MGRSDGDVAAATLGEGSGIDIPILVRELIGGSWRSHGPCFETIDPFRSAVTAHVPVSSAEDVTKALQAARLAASDIAATPARERAALLRRVADLVASRREDLAWTMTRETGKPISDSRREVDRCPETLLLCAEEAVRIRGEHVPMDATPIGAGKLAMLLRYPLGVIAAITPFNAPLNLACHKLGPALAAGDAVVLKPAPQASATVHRLVEIFQDAGTPPGWLNAVYGDEAGASLAASPLLDAISFTGSSRVGALIRQAAPLKPITLELGGNGFTIVHDDADIEKAAGLCATNGMRLAGQSCISVQNVCVARSVFERFTSLLVEGVARLRQGDPCDSATDLGPVISQDAAAAIKKKIDQAVGLGAELLLGGGVEGATVAPTVLRLTEPRGPTFDDEVFGPVVNVLAYDDLAEPEAWINAGPYGLQAGIFTGRIDIALRLARRLRVGGLILNGSSTWRSDQAPYGGVKASGSGREGAAYAIREMTEQRLLVFNY